MSLLSHEKAGALKAESEKKMMTCGACGFESSKESEFSVHSCRKENAALRAEVERYARGMHDADARFELAAEEVTRIKLQNEAMRNALHKIACAECTVHDEHCERTYQYNQCACDARVAGHAIAGYGCPVLEKRKDGP